MSDQEVWTNQVVLVGRLSSPGEELILPSGDVLMKFRVVVPRSEKSRALTTKSTVDTIDCYVFTAGLRRKVERFEIGQVVELEGAIRRRFWRAGAAAASRVEVEVTAIRKASR